MSIVVNGLQSTDLLRRARLARRSPSGSARPLSRQELADAVNAHVHETTGRTVCIDGNYIGKLERGLIRWPYESYRAALRAMLGAARDADLGFYETREATADARPAESLVSGVAGLSPVRVSVNAGGAVTVVCHDGAVGPVAIVAGGVRVLIDASSTDPSMFAPAGGGELSLSGGARVYSLAERRAR